MANDDAAIAELIFRMNGALPPSPGPPSPRYQIVQPPMRQAFSGSVNAAAQPDERTAAWEMGPDDLARYYDQRRNGGPPAPLVGTGSAAVDDPMESLARAFAQRRASGY